VCEEKKDEEQTETVTADVTFTGSEAISLWIINPTVLWILQSYYVARFGYSGVEDAD
jgi:hypothetical protein